ncbi:hypothetical protein A2154_02620 [Candidatus Gottesmanbacteria bacterium RBG_16_43_7]|uniref:Uncharacterized protein n=1 Tax=Candidatus Gottesmanbacteria bacterium RBG_16_43_7 TaxID=1798373 RepID=A0A1F5ZCS9_9BACT|nr:MAG: hypothetical protein A2154_02620 [Candidatus Gottesmanbacteria bacterium RBG_16_43_7]
MYLPISKRYPEASKKRLDIRAGRDENGDDKESDEDRWCFLFSIRKEWRRNLKYQYRKQLVVLI